MSFCFHLYVVCGMYVCALLRINSTINTNNNTIRHHHQQGEKKKHAHTITTTTKVTKLSKSSG